MTEQTSAAAPMIPDLSSTPATPEAARAALDTLRAQRLEGRVTQADYLTRSDFLARTAAGEKLATPPDPYGITLEQRLEQQYSEHMTPPLNIGDYGRLDAMSVNVRQAEQLDSAVREAFAHAGIPAHLGPALVEAVNRLSTSIDVRSPQAIETRLSSVSDALRSRWGDKFQQRFDGVADLVCELAEGNPVVGEVLDSAPWLVFASEAAVDYLDRIAQHRGRTK